MGDDVGERNIERRLVEESFSAINMNESRRRVIKLWTLRIIRWRRDVRRRKIKSRCLSSLTSSLKTDLHDIACVALIFLPNKFPGQFGTLRKVDARYDVIKQAIIIRIRVQSMRDM